MIRSRGYVQSLADLEMIPLGVTNDQGTPVLLRDVAHVQRGPEMRRGIADLNGEGEVTGGIIVMRHGENALETIRLVKEKLATLQSGLPAGVEIVTTYDRSALI
jgi:Cu(I)/Ag(I) efflux system membrane protein CusA/SilA